jgi:hypothetical protein
LAKRDYESAPLSEQLGLAGVIGGLVSDLEELRAGKITVSDAVARSLLARQIFNGVRLYLNGTKLLSDAAAPVGDAQASLAGEKRPG